MLDLENLKVLLIDDAKAMREILLYALSCGGVKQFDVATSEHRAYSLYKQKAPDIVVYNHDIALASGINFTKKIRNEKRYMRPTPVIMVSGYSSEFLVKLAISSGMNEFLVKPFGINDFLHRIKHALRNPHPTIETNSYFGPDRRRGDKQKNYTGVLKRATDIQQKKWLVNLESSNTLVPR